MGRLGYMENGFGPLVGNGGGVTCMKDVGYLTICDDEDAIKRMSAKGFKYFEVLEDNLLKYEKEPETFMGICKKYGMQLLSVCSGFHFIYEDAREEELFKTERECKLMQKFGAKYMVLCGGSIHGTGRRDEDYPKLAAGVAAVSEVCKKYGITACYHPHLGALAEGPDQIDKFFAVSDVAFCPDIAHLVAGGSDPMEMIEKYYDRIPFVHLKDLSKDGEFYPLGKGTIGDINEKVINYMKKKGYTGDWLVECDGYSGDPDEACETSYEFLKGKLY